MSSIKDIKSDGYGTVFGPDQTSGQHQILDAAAAQIAGVSGFYYANEMARRIVDVVPEEMVAPGFQVVGLKDDKEFRSVWTGLKLDQSITDALCWARLFGESAILAMVDDGQLLSTPLTAVGAKLESIRIYEKDQIEIDKLETNQRNSRFGLPKTYTIKPASGRDFKVHYTRLHVIDGCRLPTAARDSNAGTGSSVLSPSVIKAIKDYDRCHWLATQILTRKQQAVWKAKDLAALCDDNEGVYAARIRLAQLADNSGIDKPIGIDATDEEYEVLNSDIGGVPEFISMKMDRIVELTGIHEIILRNKNTGGVSASQNTALQTFYKLIDRKRKDDLHPILEFLLPFVIDETEWSVEFEPIDLPSDSEKSTILLNVSNALDKFLANQTLEVEEVRDTLEAMNLGLKLKDNPGKLPTRDDVAAAKAQQEQAQLNNNQGGNDEGQQGNS